MTDHYGNGRWGGGSRPLGLGPAQASWDVGTQDRRAEEQRRMQLQRDHFAKMERDRIKRAEDDRNHRDRQPSGSLPRAPVPKSDPFTLNDYLALAAIGGFVALLVLIWNAIVGQFHPGNPILAAIVNHGVWVVGFAGFQLGIALKTYLMKVGRLIILLATLFFGSALVYGLYQGFTGAG